MAIKWVKTKVGNYCHIENADGILIKYNKGDEFLVNAVFGDDEETWTLFSGTKEECENWCREVVGISSRRNGPGGEEVIRLVPGET